MKLSTSLRAVFAILAATLPLNAADTPPPGFTPLFNGQDLTGWVPVNVAPDTFTVRDGMIVTNGKPTGYMRSAKMYENFILEVDWQHLTPKGNSGVFIWGDGIPAMGTGYTRGIEVQVLENSFGENKGNNELFTTHGDIFPIWGAEMTPSGRIAKSGKRSFPSEDRSKPAPEWNHYRITCNAGEIRLDVNGKETTVGKDCVPRKGFIALESEGAECHFKNIFIQELPSTNTPPEQTANRYEGFTSLFNGIDFTGWKVPAGDNGHWKAQDGIIDYDARSEAAGEKHLWTEKEYGDYTLVVDWRIKDTPFLNPRVCQVLPDGSDAKDAKGQLVQLSLPDTDSGILLAGSMKHQVNIWCWPVGSGEMYGVRRDPAMPAEIRAAVTPKVKADHAVKKWNRYEITVRKGAVTVRLNGQTVVETPSIPGMPLRGPIGLQHHGAMKDGEWTSPPALVQFRNVFVKEF